MAAMSVLRNAGASEAFVRGLWSAGRSRDAARRLKCPHCGRPMGQVVTQAAGGELEVDVCPPCSAVWFDRKELDRVLREKPAPPVEPPERGAGAPPRVRDQLVVYDVASQEQGAAAGEQLPQQDESPAEWWQWLPGIFGMPVEIGEPEKKSRPFLTWLIAGTVVAAFFVTIWDLPLIVKQWGFVPLVWDRHGGLTLFTSFFLHAGLLHLLANIYFFVIFADNVEDHLGGPLLVALLAAAHLAGLAGHTLFDPHGNLPVVGASAGVSGVLGYYAVVFPGTRLGFLLLWLIPRPWVQMRAYLALVFFVLIQVLGAWVEISGFRGVAYVAHLSGLLVGVLAAVIVRVVRGRTPEYAPAG